MKILLVGYHNPHFLNTTVLREKAIGYLGFEVLSFDDASYFLPGRLRSKFPFLERWDLVRLNQSLISLAHARKPDCCLIVGGQNILPQTVSRIKEMGIPTILWTSDVPLDFKIVLDSASSYDHLFCAGSEALDIFYSKGLKNVSWLPFACDTNFHKCISLSENERTKFAKDVVFVGSFYPNRAKILETIVDYDLGVWGTYWSKLTATSPLKSKAVDIKMNFDQWVKIFNASKINIVIHYQDGKLPCHQASPKLFEAMACGCFVLCDRQKDAEILFKDKQHLVFFDDERDLREKISYYLNHDQERMRIAQEGYQEVSTKHTYQDRIKQILEILHKG